MRWRERILNTIRGGKVDRLPFVPRLDIWYQANKVRGTLPKKYKDYTLDEITTELDLGMHKVIPDFRNFNKKESIALVGLGIYDLKSNPYKIDLDSVEFTYSTDSKGATKTVFNTPYGKITTETLYNKKMSDEGSSIGHTLEHAINDLDDLDAIGYIFENIKVEKNEEGFCDFAGSIGKEGIYVGFCSLSASPMHHIMKELIGFEEFVYMLNDDSHSLERLAEKIDIFLTSVIRTANSSKADALMLGANYDSFLTWPEFFRKYITPYLKESSKSIKSAGKSLITHADGENKGLLDEFLDADIDIADSICPYPMTNLRLKDIRKTFGKKITIWGALPSVLVLEQSMGQDKYKSFIEGFLEDIGDGKNLILSFADTTPPDAKFERILEIARIAKDFRL